MREERVIIESPYAGGTIDDTEANKKYARRCMRDSLDRGEFPFASHLLYPQEGILDDDLPEERNQGILAGQAWSACADRVAVYVDHGISAGMWEGVMNALNQHIPVEMRILR